MMERIHPAAEPPTASETTGLRVVHVLHFFGPGGMEKGVATLARHASPGFEHRIVCLEKGGALESMLPPGTPVLELGKQSGNSLRFVFKLARVLRSLRPCVVHTRNWGGVDGILAARLAGIRTVVHGEHGWGMADPDGTSRKRILVRRWLSRWVRTTTCVSRDIQAWLVDRVGVRCPVVQIYNGVDTDGFTPARDRAARRRELELPEDAFLVGMVGRLDPIKDHPTLFRAFARLRARVPSTRLLCVGDGPERERLRTLAGPGVELMGNRLDVARILGALDVFALTSLNEGVSNTILEAMATGLPVVATRVGGNPELVEEGRTGRLFPPGDDEGLARLLADYARDPELRARHGEASRARAVERFRIARMVREYEEVWTRCAETARR